MAIITKFAPQTARPVRLEDLVDEGKEVGRLCVLRAKSKCLIPMLRRNPRNHQPCSYGPLPCAMYVLDGPDNTRQLSALPTQQAQDGTLPGLL